MCMCILSGPWKLSGRFRYVSVIHVSITFLSTFPPRFRHVSVAFPLRFRSRFRCASGRQAQAHARRILPPETRPALRYCCAWAAERIRSHS